MNYIDELYKKFAIEVMNTEAISERNGLVLELYEFREAIKEALEKQREMIKKPLHDALININEPVPYEYFYEVICGTVDNNKLEDL